MGGISFHELRRRVAAGYQRRVPQNPVEWCPWHVRFPSSWESTAFDFDVAPHVRGVFERFILDPTKKKAHLSWSARNMKTSTVLSVVEWVACERPAPMVLLFPDEGMWSAAYDEHIMPMLEENRELRKQLPPAHERNRRVIRFRDCRMRLAGAGSITSVAGFPALFVFKTEVNKIVPQKSSEADAYYTIESRCAGYARWAKILEEGTPADVTVCRAHRLLTSGDVLQLRYYVPCPFSDCGEYQVLDFNQLRWEKRDGQSTPALARKTARYECVHCGGMIEDRHRGPMMRAGVWLAVGEYMDANGRRCGEPEVDSDTVFFGPLSQLYSLLISGWGEVAAAGVRAAHARRDGDEEAYKKFKTEILSESWAPKRLEVKPEELAKHLRGDYLRGECPEQTMFIVTAVDVGRVERSLLFHWFVSAWWAIDVGEQIWRPQGALVDWGLQVGADKFMEWTKTGFPVKGRPQASLPVEAFRIGLDSGSYSDEVYEISDSLEHGVPLKGDSKTDRSSSVGWYSWGSRGEKINPRVLQLQRQLGLGDLLMVNSHRSQNYRLSLIEMRLSPGNVGFMYLPRDVCDNWESHKSLFDEMRSDYRDKNEWKKSGPNEAGDGVRYGRVLAELETHGGQRWGMLEFPERFSGRQETAPAVATPAPESFQSPVPSNVPAMQGAYLLSQRS